MRLTIEENEELLKKYGLAMALINTIEYLVGEIIRLRGGLNKANQEIINSLMENKTLGPKIELVKKVLTNQNLVDNLRSVNKDRTKLAHGASVEQAGKHFLMTRDGFHPLSVDELDIIIKNARETSQKLLTDLGHTHKLSEPS